MKIMGIDYGDRRVGVALSDELLMTAQPLKTIEVVNRKDLLNQLRIIKKENDVEKVVIGIPRTMDGEVGVRGEKTLIFAKHLARSLKCEPVMWDERLTTVSAIDYLNEADVRGKERRNAVDTVSACLILQNYLEYIRKL